MCQNVNINMLRRWVLINHWGKEKNVLCNYRWQVVTIYNCYRTSNGRFNKCFSAIIWICMIWRIDNKTILALHELSFSSLRLHFSFLSLLCAAVKDSKLSLSFKSILFDSNHYHLITPISTKSFSIHRFIDPSIHLRWIHISLIIFISLSLLFSFSIQCNHFLVRSLALQFIQCVQFSFVFFFCMYVSI